MPYHLAPALLPALATLLRQLHRSCLPLPHIPAAAAAAAVAAVGSEQGNAALEGTLQRLGAVERPAESSDGEPLPLAQTRAHLFCALAACMWVMSVLA